MLALLLPFVIRALIARLNSIPDCDSIFDFRWVPTRSEISSHLSGKQYSNDERGWRVQPRVGAGQKFTPGCPEFSRSDTYVRTTYVSHFASCKFIQFSNVNENPFFIMRGALHIGAPHQRGRPLDRWKKKGRERSIRIGKTSQNYALCVKSARGHVPRPEFVGENARSIPATRARVNALALESRRSF